MKLLLLVAPALLAAVASAADQPNIVFILADDWGKGGLNGLFDKYCV